MQDFFRYHLSGTVFICWTMVFLAPYCDYAYIYGFFTNEKIEIVNVLLTAVTSLVAISSPLGILIHEISMSLHLVPRLTKFALRPSMRDRNDNICKEYAHIKFAPDSVHTLSKAFSAKTRQFDITYIREQVSNLYAYCYLKINTCILAPLFGYVASLTIRWFSSTLEWPLLSSASHFSVLLPILFAIGIGRVVLIYLPRILIEIAEIELFLISAPNFRDSLSMARPLESCALMVPSLHSRSLAMSLIGKSSK